MNGLDKSLEYPDNYPELDDFTHEWKILYKEDPIYYKEYKMKFKLPSNPPVPNQTSLITDVMQSPEVVVQIKDHYAIGRYTHHIDPCINKEQGYWRINGHNGNWDCHIKGWYALPPLTKD